MLSGFELYPRWVPLMCSLIYVKVPLFSSGSREKTNTRCAKMAANLNAVQNNGNNNSKTSVT